MEQEEINAVKMTPIEHYIFNIENTARAIASASKLEEVYSHLSSYIFQKTMLKTKGVRQETLDSGDSELLRKVMEYRT